MSLRTQDPEYVGFSGILKTDMTIGACALVEVEATVDDDEFTEFVVMYRGVDIADALNENSFQEIGDKITMDWQRLIQKSKQDRLAEIY